jgi:HAE1 family hydrophobic/amphiphilic exporter-1
VAILVSGFVSVTLTPMLSARFLKGHQGGHGKFYQVTERFFDWMLRVYDRSLVATLRHRFAVLAISFAVLGGSIWLFQRVPKGFLPSEDTSQIFTTVEANQGISHLEMYQNIQKLIGIAQKDPNVRAFFAGFGGTSGSVQSSGPNFGRLYFHLKDRDERKIHVDQVMEELRPKLNSTPGMRAFLQNPPAIRLGGSLTKSLYQFTLMGTDIQQLYASAQTMEAEMAKIPGLQDVTSDLQIKSPELHVVIDRDKASSLNVTAEKIENALFDAYGPRWVSTIYAPDNQYRVLLEVEREFQEDPSLMSALYVRNGNGDLIPMTGLARLEPKAGPLSINHYGQLPAITISFNLKPGVSLGDAVTQIQDLADRKLTGTITTAFQGAAQAFQQSLKSLWILLLVAILVVYIVLGILYESFIHPITILSGLPSAGFGALLTLWLFGLDLNIYSFVGLILLIGIVKKNAIMQIDFALDAQRNQGMSPYEAIYKGCLTRFRPIMMTTMAALLGALPSALGHGAGGEARRPLGLCVVGGLMFSQLITLYLTPVVYLYLSGLQARWEARRRKPASESESALAPAGD